MEYTRCLNMGLNLIILKWALHYLHDVIYGKRWGPDWSFRRCFCSRKRCVRLWRYDVRKYTADAILFREIQCKKNGQFNVFAAFSVRSGLEYARITITHVCFIALTLAGSLGRCLNPRPIGLVFKQHPRDPANVNAWKNMCDPYTLLYSVPMCMDTYWLKGHISLGYNVP